jgi:hypothetical protein
MQIRTITAAVVSAVLALSAMSSIAVAQDETEPTDDISVAGTQTGVLESSVDEDGRTTWFLNVDGTLVELQFGPSWFTDLAALFGVAPGDEVEIGGNLRDGMPNENASDVAQENAAHAPKLHVKTIGGQERPKGKPAWAGGPKVQGEAHPGFEGWSKGQAKKAEHAAAANEHGNGS